MMARVASRKEAWVVGMRRGYDDFASTRHKEALDAAFQCFLLGAGIGPENFDSLPHLKQAGLR